MANWKRQAAVAQLSSKYDRDTHRSVSSNLLFFGPWSFCGDHVGTIVSRSRPGSSCWWHGRWQSSRVANACCRNASKGLGRRHDLRRPGGSPSAGKQFGKDKMLHDLALVQDFSLIQSQQPSCHLVPGCQSLADVIQHGRGLEKRNPLLQLSNVPYASKEHVGITIVFEYVVVVDTLWIQQLLRRDTFALQLTGAQVKRNAMIIVQAPHAVRPRRFQTVVGLHPSRHSEVLIHNRQGNRSQGL